VGNTVLFEINHIEYKLERENMEEKRNKVAIPSVLANEIEDGEVR
jgi:hypothetical protein